MAGIFNDSELVLLLLIFAWVHGAAVNSIITAIRGIRYLNKLKQPLYTTKTKGLIIKKEINGADAFMTVEFLARVSGVQMVLTYAWGSREHDQYTEKHFIDIIYDTGNPYHHTESLEALINGFAKRTILMNVPQAVVGLMAFPMFLLFVKDENSFWYIPSSVAGEFYLLSWAFMPISWLLNVFIMKYVLGFVTRRSRNGRVPENDDLVRLDPLRANDVETQQDEAVDMKVDQVDTHEIAGDSDLQIAMTETIALSEPAAAAINNDEELPQYESVNEKNDDVGNNEQSDVGKWLKSVGDIFYSDYYQLFMDNGFDTMDVVKTLTDNDLENVVGISKVGHRRRLMLEIEKL